MRRVPEWAEGITWPRGWTSEGPLQNPLDESVVVADLL